MAMNTPPHSKTTNKLAPHITTHLPDLNAANAVDSPQPCLPSQAHDMSEEELDIRAGS